MRVERIGDATLYLGDCLEILPTLGPADAVVTDPPWGLNGGSGTTSKQRAKAVYSGAFEDSPEYIDEVVVPAIRKALLLCNGRGMVACGARCLYSYPRPRAIGGFYQPAAVGMSPWGFAGFSPVLFYGKDPRDGKGQSSVMTTLTEPPSTNDHPCAKPDGAMRWMVGKASLEGQAILDPFMGSGTTGVACVSLGRKFIGIEIEPKYFDIACKRIKAAYDQPRLFDDPKPEPVQHEMDLEGTS